MAVMSCLLYTSWNTVDWDVSGNEPSLKKDLNKKYTAPTVTLDGKTVKATYGEKLSEKVAAGVSGNVATLGAALGGAAYYEDLPVLNNMTLVKATVDFSKLAGEWTPVSSADAALKVAAKVSLGAKEYTGVIYATEKNLPVILSLIHIYLACNIFSGIHRGNTYLDMRVPRREDQYSLNLRMPDYLPVIRRCVDLFSVVRGIFPDIFDHPSDSVLI